MGLQATLEAFRGLSRPFEGISCRFQHQVEWLVVGRDAAEAPKPARLVAELPKDRHVEVLASLAVVKDG